MIISHSLEWDMERVLKEVHVQERHVIVLVMMMS